MAEGGMSNLRTGGRLDYLDGLRGIAALIVVVFHFCSAYLPGLFISQGVSPSWISDTPASIFYNGRFSVIIFFVLSGLVVSNSGMKRSPIVGTLLFRYLRLALPATVSVIVAWALLSLFPIEANTLNALAPNEWLSITYQGSIPSFSQALYHGFFGMFISGTSLFNNVLWTMKVELLGSWVIYVTYFFVTNTRLRVILIGTIGVALSPLHLGIYEGFVAGALLREVWAAGRLRPVVPHLFLVMGLVLGSFGDGFHERHHLPHVPRSFMLGEGTGLVYPLAASFIVYACMTSLPLKKLLSRQTPRFLGRVSFSFYLYHVPLIYTIFTVWYLHTLRHENLDLVVLFIGFMLFSLAFAYFATQCIDEPVVKMISYLRDNKRRSFLSRRSIAVPSEGATTP